VRDSDVASVYRRESAASAVFHDNNLAPAFSGPNSHRHQRPFRQQLPPSIINPHHVVGVVRILVRSNS
jgi:hypothetical protein